MNDNLLQELEKHFDDFINLKDPDKFYSGLRSYFRFIEDTFPFNNIAHTLFSSRSTPSLLRSNTSALYESLVFNKPNNFTINPIDPMSIKASQLSSFHSYMKDGFSRLFTRDTGNKRVITKDADGDYYNENKLPEEKSRPHCIAEGKWGYLKFNKYGNKIKIGSQDSRHFRLLQCLLEPMGTAKTIEGVYEAIKLPKDKSDPDLSGWDSYKKNSKKVSIIQNAIKELQKGNKLLGKLKFMFDDTKSKIFIKYIG